MDSNLTVTLGTPQPRGRVRTELTASAELEVRIHSPPAPSPLRTRLRNDFEVGGMNGVQCPTIPNSLPPSRVFPCTRHDAGERVYTIQEEEGRPEEEHR